MAWLFFSALALSALMSALAWIGVRAEERLVRRTVLHVVAWRVYILGIHAFGIWAGSQILAWFGVTDPDMKKNFFLAWLLPYMVACVFIIREVLRRRRARFQATREECQSHGRAGS